MSASNESTQPKDIEGSTGRIRTQSENSNISDGDAATSAGKRQRTTSQTFVVSGLTAASPPRFVTLEEIMQAANGIRNMALVHQIVMDKGFRLEKYEPEQDSLAKVVKENMMKAFWNILREELADDPPVYTQALVLLNDVKDGLMKLLLPQHTKLKQQIGDVLDSELIRQQAEKGVLDFQYYASYVTGLLAHMCAPVRDDKIKELQGCTDVVEAFSGILETLDLMALDMANFKLEMYKPDIIAHSVELERNKFAELLKVQPDGLEVTRQWILKHLNAAELTLPSNGDYAAFTKSITHKTVRHAYLDLLEWPDKMPYPETLLLDEERLVELKVLTNKLIAVATILLISLSNVSADLQSIAAYKVKLKDHCSVLFETYKSDDDLNSLIPSICQQVVKDTREAQETYKLPALSDDRINSLTEQLKGVSSADNRIKQLVRRRVREFFENIIQSATADPEKVPAGLTTLHTELMTIAGQFLRLVSYNMTVFSIYYYDIVSSALPSSPTN